jgi:hypothetical protein
MVSLIVVILAGVLACSFVAFEIGRHYPCNCLKEDEQKDFD